MEDHMLRRLSFAVALALLFITPAAPPAAPVSCAAKGCVLAFSPLYLLNNLWNASGATGTQSITVASPTAWSTTFSWSRPDDWQVTSYAAAILGWHWGWRVPRELTGLPIPVVGAQRVLTESAFTIMPAGSAPLRYDMAYDLWLHGTPDPKPNGSDPRVEVMIWLSYSQDYLGGDEAWVASPTIAGRRWKVRVEATRGKTPDTISFVIDGPNLSGASLDLKEFLAWTVANRPDILPPTHFLTSVQFGPEIYKGAGTIDVTTYTVRLQ
jgi:xyloglucan-specific endo-beta-1,4-glucanase